jgi:hypothetical protein
MNNPATTFELIRLAPLRSSDPASGRAGELYYNTSTNKVRFYNGTSWSDISAGSFATTALDNLTTTSINKDLIGDTNLARNLGSPSVAWASGYIQNLVNLSSITALYGADFGLSTAATTGIDSSGNLSLGTGGSVNGNSGNILITAGTPSGTGIRGNVQVGGSWMSLLGQMPLRFYDFDNSNFVGFKSATTVPSNVTWTLPSSDGTSGQFLKTDGSGNLSWQSIVTSSALSSITAAVSSNTIDNSNFAQVWNWNSLTSGTGLQIATAQANNFTGSLLDLTVSVNSVSHTGSALSITNNTNTTGKGISITMGTAGAPSTGIFINSAGNNPATRGIDISMATGSQGYIGISVAGNNNANGTGTPIMGRFQQTNTLTNNQTIAVQASVASPGSVDTMAGDFQLTSASAIGTAVRATHSGTSGFAFDGSVTGTGTREALRLQNIVSAANNSASQLTFAANRTTGGLTSVAGISGAITDITNTAYKGALIFSTANNAAPTERWRITETGAFLPVNNDLSDIGSASKQLNRIFVNAVNDNTGITVINANTKFLIDSSGLGALNWNTRMLLDQVGGNSLDWSSNAPLGIRSFKNLTFDTGTNAFVTTKDDAAATQPIRLTTGNSGASTSGDILIKTGSSQTGTGQVRIASGNGLTSSTGLLQFRSGDVTAGTGFTTGLVDIGSGISSNDSSTGAVNISTGIAGTTVNSGNATSGLINITTGDVYSFNTAGDINILSGNIINGSSTANGSMLNLQSGGAQLGKGGQILIAAGGGGTGGDIFITAGQSSSGDAGIVDIAAGTANGATGGFGQIILHTFGSITPRTDNRGISILVGSTSFNTPVGAGLVTGELSMGTADTTDTAVGRFELFAGDTTDGSGASSTIDAGSIVGSATNANDAGSLQIFGGFHTGLGNAGNIRLTAGRNSGTGAGNAGSLLMQSGEIGDPASTGITGEIRLTVPNNAGLGSIASVQIFGGSTDNAANTNDAGGVALIGGDTVGSGRGGNVGINAGAGAGTGDGGNIQITGGQSAAGVGGGIELVAGFGPNSGTIIARTADATNSGAIDFHTGALPAATTGTTGSTSLATGSILGLLSGNSAATGSLGIATGSGIGASGSTIDTGDLSITTGGITGGASGTTGSISLITGSTSIGTQGSIVFGSKNLSLDASGFGNFPVWKKYTLTVANFATAATSNSITLFSLPAHAAIHNVIISQSTAFTGTGVTSYTVSVGVAGNNTKYATAFDVHQAAGASVAQASASFNFESKTAAVNITATATSNVNLNFAAAAGSVDIWVLASVFQAPT